MIRDASEVAHRASVKPGVCGDLASKEDYWPVWFYQRFVLGNEVHLSMPSKLIPKYKAYIKVLEANWNKIGQMKTEASGERTLTEWMAYIFDPAVKEFDDKKTEKPLKEQFNALLSAVSLEVNAILKSEAAKVSDGESPQAGFISIATLGALSLTAPILATLSYLSFTGIIMLGLAIAAVVIYAIKLKSGNSDLKRAMEIEEIYMQAVEKKSPGLDNMLKAAPNRNEAFFIARGAVRKMFKDDRHDFLADRLVQRYYQNENADQNKGLHIGTVVTKKINNNKVKEISAPGQFIIGKNCSGFMRMKTFVIILSFIVSGIVANSIYSKYFKHPVYNENNQKINVYVIDTDPEASQDSLLNRSYHLELIADQLIYLAPPSHMDMVCDIINNSIIQRNTINVKRIYIDSPDILGIVDENGRKIILPILFRNISAGDLIKGIIRVLQDIESTGNIPSVVNVSLGTYTDIPLMHALIRELNRKGVIIVAASGNDNTNIPSYPAAYEEVIAVGAGSKGMIFGHKEPYSNRGSYVDITDSGEYVRKITLGSSTIEYRATGTSFSSPRIAALVAGLLVIKNDLRPEEIARIITKTADPLVGEQHFNNGCLARVRRIITGHWANWMLNSGT